MLESEVEITEISVQISALEGKKEELVLREENKRMMRDDSHIIETLTPWYGSMSASFSNQNLWRL